MNKIYLLLAIGAITLSSQARDLKFDVDMSHNLWWEAPEVPCVKFTITDTLGNVNNSPFTFRVTSDRDESTNLMVFTNTARITANGKQEVKYTLNFAEPGFYKCVIEDEGNVVKRFNIGYEPTLVNSLPDSKPDFDQFWQTALDELAATPGNFTMTEDPEKSGKVRKAYKVTMNSLGNEPIKGYVYIPIEPGTYPALIYYIGYGGKPWDFAVDAHGDLIEFVTSIRGQMYSEPDNHFGDWIRYNLDNPSEYYYRGAFMDAVRAIDFVAQLPQVDTSRIFAEGGSQGGALTLAAASLDKRLRAIMPYIPFLNDYRDYFKIVSWPGNAVKEEAQRLNMTEDQMYDNLTYFDIKNLVRRITCPVLMGIGLQDGVCPPHTNMASYTLIKSPKQLIIYPECGHWVDYSHWNPARDAFIAQFPSQN